MSVERASRLGEAALQQIFAAAGVAATPEELATVSRTVSSIEAAAAALCTSQSFDDTAEWFFRLLEQTGPEGTPA